jgi:hypothetical protein
LRACEAIFHNSPTTASIQSTCHKQDVHALTNSEATVVLKFNQGAIRQRGVSVGGVFFGYFLDKQKVTKETASAALSAFICAYLWSINCEQSEQSIRVN